MKKKVGWLIVSVLMVAALLLGSCAPAETPTPTPSAETPTYGGTLNYARAPYLSSIGTPYYASVPVENTSGWFMRN